MKDENSKETISVSQTIMKKSPSQTTYGRNLTPNHATLNNKITLVLPSQKYMKKIVKYNEKIKKSLDKHKFTGFNLQEIIHNRNIQSNALKTTYANIAEKYKMRKNIFNNLIGASNEKTGSLTRMLFQNKEDLLKMKDFY